MGWSPQPPLISGLGLACLALVLCVRGLEVVDCEGIRNPATLPCGNGPAMSRSAAGLSVSCRRIFGFLPDPRHSPTPTPTITISDPVLRMCTSTQARTGARGKWGPVHGAQQMERVLIDGRCMRMASFVNNVPTHTSIDVVVVAFWGLFISGLIAEPSNDVSGRPR